ncbi:ImmA/IrrE family metallo-endopeptidase [Kribbella kalugense]|uniref:Uncharacterized protein DUF955 n=1 Tax=Kribbella kalugense TaxID=2512221 RepID=A0A4R8A0Y4_9ACTN|nr:ImmA/IrrE family metallo-endopeptidase [Kribbella kalugense]TDW24157.1 uncharacterized protein DUF955 [Kribbella kalugense]
MATTAQRRHALQAAGGLLDELGINQEDPVDVFDIIDQLGLWLVFNPLNSLLGAVVPKGNGGIMLTTQRGPSIQRYTAAHEVGHWLLDVNEPAFDAETDIFHPSEDRERLAQLFAGQLLMPPPLVFAACARHGIASPRDASGAAVYLVARDMGASYEAAVRQLSNLDIIEASRRDYLLSLTPAQIKTDLCYGHRPRGAVDVWPVGMDSDRTNVQITAGDEVCLALPENRSTGHRWLTAADLQARTERRRSPAPGLFAPPLSPTTAQQPRGPANGNSAGRRPALERLPGNAGAQRTLPTRSTATGDSPDAALETDAWQPRAPELREVDDRFRAGWAGVAPSEVRAARRAIAGRTDVTLPESLQKYRARSDPDEPGESQEPASQLDTATIPVAATGRRLIALRSDGEGMTTVELYYTSAFDPDSPVAAGYQLNVAVSPPPQVAYRRRLLAIATDDTREDRNDGGGSS